MWRESRSTRCEALVLIAFGDTLQICEVRPQLYWNSGLLVCTGQCVYCVCVCECVGFAQNDQSTTYMELSGDLWSTLDFARCLSLGEAVAFSAVSFSGHIGS